MENSKHNQDQPLEIKAQKNEEEIDFIAIIQKLWWNRKFIFKVTSVFIILGLIVAISTPNTFTATCTMVPQTGQKSPSGSLGGLAAMAGINLGSLNSGEILSPSVYPMIITNINFQKELINTKFHFEGIAQPITLLEFYTESEYHKFSISKTLKKYTIGLPYLVLNSFRNIPKKDSITNGSAIKSITIQELEIINALTNNLMLKVNNKDGYITLSVNMPEPLLAAEIAQKGQELLQKYITEFKIQKVKSNLEFVEKSYEDAKKKFELKQEELAKFRDSNKNFTSSVAKTQEEKLVSEYNLLLGIYTELAKQTEQAKISVRETTPILTIIEPVVVPHKKSKPSRVLLLFFHFFLGLITGIVLVFSIQYLEDHFYPNIKRNWFIPKIY